MKENIKSFVHAIMLAAILHSSLVLPAQNTWMVIQKISSNKVMNYAYVGENILNDQKESLVKQSENAVQNKVVNTVTNVSFSEAEQQTGVIGISATNPIDDPSDNIFSFEVPAHVKTKDKVVLTYDLYGVQDHNAVSRSINERLAIGGYLITENKTWTKQTEEIDASWLKQGQNTVMFTIPKGANHTYAIKNLKVQFIEQSSNVTSQLVLQDQKITIQKDNKIYLKGFVKAKNQETLKVTAEGQSLEVRNGEFEGFIQLNDFIKNKKQIQIVAYDANGLLGQEVVFLELENQAQKLLNIEPLVDTQSKLFKASTTESLRISGASILIGQDVLTTDQHISITRLRNVDMAPLADGMINVTKGGKGYRFLPDGIQFNKPVKLTIAYDSLLLPKGYEPKDIKTFYFDTHRKKWLVVKTDTLNYKNQTLTTLTTHFTDYINGVIEVPESPQTNAFVPTMMNDIKAADPSSEITLISPPSASQKGSASIGYPIKIPAGRLGMQPNVNLQYSNEGGNSWLGLGWNINTPAITLDTRWGVPTFDPTNESEMYQLNGEQLMYPRLPSGEEWMPNRHVGDYGISVVEVKPMDRGTSTKTFYPRKQGSFAKTERFGNNPSNYFWKVTETNGTVNWYGGGPLNSATPVVNENSIIRSTPKTANTLGNIVHWALYMTIDVHGNYIKYGYAQATLTSTTDDNLNNGRYFYLDNIKYTGIANGSTYTDGNYQIKFLRQNAIKSDVSINGRLGYKQIDPYLLSKIEVSYTKDLNQKRSYSFRYKKAANNTVGVGGGRFKKNLLEAVVEEGTLGTSTQPFYEHTFEYYDDLADENGSIKFFSNPIESKICNDTYVPGNVTNPNPNPGGTNPGGTNPSNGGSGVGTCSIPTKACYAVKLPRNYKLTPLYKYDSEFVSLTKHDAGCNPFHIKVTSLFKNGLEYKVPFGELNTSNYNESTYINKCPSLSVLPSNTFNNKNIFDWTSYLQKSDTTNRKNNFNIRFKIHLSIFGLTLKNVGGNEGIVAAVDNYSGVSNSLFFGTNNNAKVQNRAAFRAKFFSEENMDVALNYQAYNDQNTPVYDFEFTKKFKKSGPYPIGTSVSSDIIVKTCNATYNFGTYQLADNTDLENFKSRIIAQFPNSTVTVYKDYNFVNISISNPKEEFLSIELVGTAWRSDYPFSPCYEQSNMPPPPSAQLVTEERTKYPPTTSDLEYAIAHWIADGNELNEPILEMPLDILVNTKDNPVNPAVDGSYQYIYKNKKANWIDANGAIVADAQVLDVLKTVTPDVAVIQEHHKQKEIEKRQQQQQQAKAYLNTIIQNKTAHPVKITPAQNNNQPATDFTPPPSAVASTDLIAPPSAMASANNYKKFFEKFFKNSYSFISSNLLSVDQGCNSYPSFGLIMSGLNSTNYDYSRATLGSSKSVSYSVGIYGGVGIAFSTKSKKDKLTTLGIQYNRIWGYNESAIALVDINGDGLEDQVVKDDDQLYYKTHTVNRTYNDKNEPIVTHDFGPKRPINGLNEFYFTKTSGNSFNFSVSFGFRKWNGSVGIDFSNNKSTTEVYFTDANGDGLIDIAYNGQIWFNYLDANGNPNFDQNSALTENMLITASALEIETPEIIDEHPNPQPNYDVVKVWQAPTDGTIAIEQVITNTDANNEAQLTVEWAKKVEEEEPKNCYNAGFVAPKIFRNEYLYEFSWSALVQNANCEPLSMRFTSFIINGVANNIDKPWSFSASHSLNGNPTNLCPQTFPLYPIQDYKSTQNKDFVVNMLNHMNKSINSSNFKSFYTNVFNHSRITRGVFPKEPNLITHVTSAMMTFTSPTKNEIAKLRLIISSNFRDDMPEERDFKYTRDLSAFYSIPNEIKLITSTTSHNLGTHNIYDNAGFQTFSTAVKNRFPQALVTKDSNQNVSININDTTETLVSLTLSYNGTTQTVPFTTCSANRSAAPPSATADNQDNIWKNVTLTKEDSELGLMQWKAEGNELKLPFHEVPLNVFVDATNNTINSAVSGYYSFTKDKTTATWKDNQGNAITDVNVIAVLQQLLPGDADSIYQQNQAQFAQQEQAQREKSQQEAITFLQQRAEKLQKATPPPPSAQATASTTAGCTPTYLDPCLLYGVKLAPNQSIPNTITAATNCNATSIVVKKGDKIYFRLHAKPEGNPIVNWEPTVKYIDEKATLIDQNNLPAYNSSYKDSFLVTSDTEEIQFLESGTATIYLPILTVPNGVLSDAVRLEIIQSVTKIIDTPNSNGNNVEETETVFYTEDIPISGKTIGGGAISRSITVAQDQLVTLKFKVSSTSNVDFQKVKWTPKVNLKSSKPVMENGEKLGDLNRDEDFYPTINYQTYKPYICAKTPQPQVLNSVSVLTLSPNLAAFPRGDFGRVNFVVKANKKLLGKFLINVATGSVNLVSGTSSQISIPAGISTIEYSLNAEDGSKIDSNLKTFLDHISPTTVLANYSNGAKVVASQAHLNEYIVTPMGTMYRNWGQFLYNPNIEDKGKNLTNGLVGQFISEAALTFTPAQMESIENSLSEANITSSFGVSEGNSNTEINENQATAFENTNKGLVKNMGLIKMKPYKNDLKQEFWIGNDEYNFVSATQMSAQTMDMVIQQIIQDEKSQLVQVDINTKAHTINKTSKGSSKNFSGGVYSINVNKSWDGKNTTLSDYVDVNGDRYPDIVTKNDVQYTNATGGLKAKQDRINKMDPSFSESKSKGVGASGTFGKAGNPTASPSSSESKAQRNDSESADSPGNYSGSLNEGESNAKIMFVDVNGDGLSDVVNMSNSTALLNLTPHQPLESSKWNTMELFKSNNVSVSLGLGINWRQASMQGGVSVSASENNTLNTFVDVNADGLPDLVTQTNPNLAKIALGELPKLTVSYNTGSTFDSPIEMPNFSLLNESISSSEAANVGYTYSLLWRYFFRIFFKASFSAKASADKSVSNTNKLITDYDGDGYPDLVERLGFGNVVKVQHSRIRRTNMLKKVNNPLGGSFTVDYQVSPVTYDNPHAKWVMSEVVVQDGVNHPQDGADKMIQRFSYEKGRYDRRERDFYGFETVKTMDYNMDTEGKPTNVYRTSIAKYHNRSYFLNGMMKEQSVISGEDQNARFQKTENTYAIYALTDQFLLDKNKKQTENFDVGGTKGRRAASVVLESTKTSIYEKSGTPLQIEQQFDYDTYARVTKVSNLGDVNNSQDNYTTDIVYFNDSELNTFGVKEKNIIAIPKSISVKETSGTERRYRENKNIDAFGRPKTITSKIKSNENTEVTLEYHTNGNLKKVTYPKNHNQEQQSYTYEYDLIEKKHVINVTDSKNFISRAEYNLFTDKIIKSIDIAQKVVEYDYDIFGRLTAVRSPKEGTLSPKPNTISFSYYPTYDALPASGVPSKANISRTFFTPFAVTKHYDVQRPSDPIETITFMDGTARPIQVKKDITYMNNPAMSISGVSTYDAFGRAVTQYHPYFETKSSTASTNYILSKTLNPINTAVASTIYDELNRAIEAQDFEGNKSFVEYSLATDAFGNRTMKEKSTVPNGSNTLISESYKDGSGKVTTTMQVDAGKNITTKFVYNAIGELQSYSNAANQTTMYEYDMLGRKTKRTQPDSGVTVYAYDGASNLTSLETANLRANGQKINYEYDYAGRLLKEVYPTVNGQSNLINVTYTYGLSNAAPAEQKGRLVKVQDATGTQEFKYGDMGEVIENKRVISTPNPNDPERTFITKYAYDSFNRMQKMTYPDNEAVSYTYDLGGKLTKVSGTAAGSSVAYDYIKSTTYDYFENKTEIQYGNGTVTKYDYTNQNLRMDKITTSLGSTIYRSSKYDYDNVGNITKVDNPASAQGQIGGSFTHNYTYDNLNRLKTANGSFTATTGAQNANNDKSSAYNLAMTYDDIHRITKKEQQHTKNGRATGNSYANNYNYTSGKNTVSSVVNSAISTTYSFDQNGNMNFSLNFVGGRYAGEKSMYWDENNRLRAVKSNNLLHHYLYDATGERVMKGSSQYNATTQNGSQIQSSSEIGSYTIYPSAFMVLSPTGYTKHYYNGGERIASVIGAQDASIFNSSNTASRGTSIKTSNSLKDAQRLDLEQLAKQAEIGRVTFKQASTNTIDSDLEEAEPQIAFKSSAVNNTLPKVYFYHSDHLGTNSYITNNSATAVQFFVNLPFGEPMVEHKSTEFESDYLFTGHELDRETGLYYAHARYLNTSLGIWLSVDPLAEKYPFASPYNYVLNNPVRYIDPDGRNHVDPIKKALDAVTNITNVLQGKKWIDYQDIHVCGKAARLQNNQVKNSNPVYDGGQNNMFIDKKRQDIQDKSDNIKTTAVNISKGINTLVENLKKGRPIVVGVNYKDSNSPGNDNVATDHYVNVVGMGKDENGVYFSYYDNYVDPTSSPTTEDREKKGTDVALNRFYYDEKSMKLIDETPTTITGPNHAQYGNFNYTVTEIKPNQ